MKRSFFVSVSLAVMLSVSLAAAPMALAAPQTASKSITVQLQTASQKAAAAKKAAAAAIKTATKKVNTTKSAYTKASTALKKAQSTRTKAQTTLTKAQTAYNKANAALRQANVKVTTAKTKANVNTAKKASTSFKKTQTALKKAQTTYNKAQTAYNKANTAAKKALSQYNAAMSALQKLTGPTTKTANYTVTMTDMPASTANPQAQAAAPASTAVDASAIVGLTQDQLVAQYGQPNRTEPSEYGFNWFVYNSDYSRFLMAGVRNGAVVAVYTNAKGLQYGSAFSLGSSIATVRAALGKPVTSLRSGNTVAMLPHTDEKDLFILGDKDVTVFYDMIGGGVVTSVMVLPAADEAAYVTGGQPMSEELGAAYQRLSVDLTNAIRVRHGLKALQVVDLNTKLALSRSTDMRDRNYFDHITPDSLSPADQAKRMGISYVSLGENIAYGHRDAIFASERFMNSEGHRANVLKDYTKLGVGVAVGGDMRVIITCIFTK